MPLCGGLSDPEVSMPIATELRERASDQRKEAMRVRRLSETLAVGDRAQLDSYAARLDQKAADLERQASGLVGA
jgi:hypothetical protein